MNLTKILSAILPIFLLLLSFRLLVFNENFYQNEFEKTGVYNKLSKDKANNELQVLLSYLKGKTNSLERTDFFNDKEKAHLEDVKELINKAINLLYAFLVIIISLATYLVYKKKVKMLLTSLVIGGVSSILISIFLAIISLISFNSLFYYFHLISFSNNLWLLDPAKDNLINLFKQQFFYDFFKRLILYTSFLSLTIIVLGVLISKWLFHTSIIQKST